MSASPPHHHGEPEAGRKQDQGRPCGQQSGADDREDAGGDHGSSLGRGPRHPCGQDQARGGQGVPEPVDEHEAGQRPRPGNHRGNQAEDGTTPRPRRREGGCHEKPREQAGGAHHHEQGLGRTVEVVGQQVAAGDRRAPGRGEERHDLVGERCRVAVRRRVETAVLDEEAGGDEVPGVVVPHHPGELRAAGEPSRHRHRRDLQHGDRGQPGCQRDVGTGHRESRRATTPQQHEARGGDDGRDDQHRGQRRPPAPATTACSPRAGRTLLT